MSTVLCVENLRKIYPGKKREYAAVDDISFHLKKGEILGLLGPNGAGKTTTIQMLLGILKPTSGRILYFGKELFKHRSEVLKEVVFASTYVSLPWRLTISQNLEIYGRLYGIPLAPLRLRIDELLERFGLIKKKEEEVSTLSAGQITRLVLVKAFMVRPKVVLLDEPTASLDPEMAQEIRAFILEERKTYGVSILFTSHNMTEVAEVCDRTLFVQKGKILADDRPERLARSVASSKLRLVVADKMAQTVKVAEKMNLSYEIDYHTLELRLDEKKIAHFLMALAREGIEYSGIEIIEPTLEDYFLTMARNFR